MKGLFSIIQFLLLISVSSSIPTENYAPQDCKSNAVFTLKDIEFSANYIYSTPAHLAVSGGSISCIHPLSLSRFPVFAVLGFPNYVSSSSFLDLRMKTHTNLL
jgi:hypothetical protein